MYWIAAKWPGFSRKVVAPEIITILARVRLIFLLRVLPAADRLHCPHRHRQRHELHVVSLRTEVHASHSFSIFPPDLIHVLIVSHSDYCTLPSIKVHNIVVMMQ